jgi:preprotein translocase subunit SecY
MSSPVLFDGTSLLIAVGVALEVSNQLDAALIDKKYEGFTSRHSVRK